MALKAGYRGIKKYLANKLNQNYIGSAIFKDSTSVVTDSSDLVESMAVKDIVGWGNKNLARLESGSIDQTTGEDIAGNNKRTVGIVSITKGSTITISGFLANETPNYRIFYFSDGVYQSNEVLNYDDTTLTATVTVGNTIDGIRLQITPTKVDDTHFMIEYGSTATSYEPYHASVDATKADNSVIGTVEDGTNPTKAYAVGEHFIRNGKFCTVTVAVTTSSTWTLGSNYVEGTIADNLVKQDTFSGAIDSSHNVVINTDSNRVVLQAYVTSQTVPTLIFRSYTTGNIILQASGLAVGTTVSGTYYYI